MPDHQTQDRHNWSPMPELRPITIRPPRHNLGGESNTEMPNLVADYSSYEDESTPHEFNIRPPRSRRPEVNSRSLEELSSTLSNRLASTITSTVEACIANQLSKRIGHTSARAQRQEPFTPRTQSNRASDLGSSFADSSEQGASFTVTGRDSSLPTNSMIPPLIDHYQPNHLPLGLPNSPATWNESTAHRLNHNFTVPRPDGSLRLGVDATPLY